MTGRPVHEYAIAEGVIGIVLEQAEGRRVRKVGMTVGHLRQVVPSALTFSFDLVARDTLADGAELELESVPAEGRCRDCGEESRLDGFPLACGACGSFDLEVLRGEELRVEWLELEDDSSGVVTGQDEDSRSEDAVEARRGGEP